MTHPEADDTGNDEKDEAEERPNAAASAAVTPPPLPPSEATPPAAELDPRRHAVRPDLAAVALRGQVVSPRYSAGVVRQVTRAAEIGRASCRERVVLTV